MRYGVQGSLFDVLRSPPTPRQRWIIEQSEQRFRRRHPGYVRQVVVGEVGAFHGVRIVRRDPLEHPAPDQQPTFAKELAGTFDFGDGSYVVFIHA
jgi:hypothetical protein